MKICFATNNPHKLKEVRQLLGRAFEVVDLDAIQCYDELPETHPTMEGNSLQKALYVYEKFHIPCFADDSGLEVEALDNAPGVYSARYAGPKKNNEDNIRLLLKNMEGITNRKARFRAVVTYIDTKGQHVFEGTVSGTINTQETGTGGFGYDPVFIPDGHNRTFAEMSPAEKNSMSHRAIAMQKLAAFLAS